MLGYTTDELIGMPARNLYVTEEDYVHAGETRASELKANGQSRIRARFRRKNGSLMDCEIQIASLNTKNPLYSRMITITDITKRLALTRELEHLSKMPHLELNPVIEVNERVEIRYFTKLPSISWYATGTGRGSKPSSRRISVISSPDPKKRDRVCLSHNQYRLNSHDRAHNPERNIPAGPTLRVRYFLRKTDR